MRALGLWNDERASNILDGGAPFYQVYETSDAQYISVGAIEEKFFAELLGLIGQSDLEVPARDDREGWIKVHQILQTTFAKRSRDEWEKVFAGTDACVAPVLSLSEAPEHEHLREWGTFVEIDGVVQPAPTPRFSRTPGAIQRPPPRPGQNGKSALRDWGFEDHEIQDFLAGSCWCVGNEWSYPKWIIVRNEIARFPFGERLHVVVP
jgi:alpha-methylacyl-CoA racemase